MKTSEITNCPYLTKDCTTFEEDGFIQFNPTTNILMMHVRTDGEEVCVDSFQRTWDDEDGEATGWVITYSDGSDCSEVMDGDEFTVHIYRDPLVL